MQYNIIIVTWACDAEVRTMYDICGYDEVTTLYSFIKDTGKSLWDGYF